MSKDFGIPSDNRLDIRSGVDAKADYGGDLAKDSGVDLNKSTLYSYESGEYDYGDYQESGEVSNPVDTGSDSSDYGTEYTNDDIRTSLDGSEGEDLNKFSKDGGTEQADSALENFQEDTWSDLSLEEQKQSMTSLADCVADMTGNENPPEIVFRNDMDDGA